MGDGGPLYDAVSAAMAAKDTAIATNATNIGTNSTNIQSTIDQLVQGYKNVGTTGHTPADLNTVVAASINGRITALEGPMTVTQYTSSGTWTNPTPALHNLVTVICINGGQGGARASTTHAAGAAPGGLSGGYVSQQFYTDALTSTVAMTIGTGGAGSTTSATAGSTGGVTSFGGYLSGIAGVGSIVKADGSYATAVPPGNGGTGAAVATGTSNSWNDAPQNGQGGPFAAGGLAGLDAAGGNGAAAPSTIPSGGGGGGGGGANSGNTVFNGGAGGFPGGGGGGGGNAGTTNAGNGGAGAAGCIFVIT